MDCASRAILSFSSPKVWPIEAGRRVVAQAELLGVEEVRGAGPRGDLEALLRSLGMPGFSTEGWCGYSFGCLPFGLSFLTRLI